jgi:hypothetical protein
MGWGGCGGLSHCCTYGAQINFGGLTPYLAYGYDPKRRMILNRGGQPEARVQIEGPQVKYICIKELKILPLDKSLYININSTGTVYRNN